MLRSEDDRPITRLEPEQHAALVRRIAWKLMPLLWLSAVLSYLDR